VAGLLKNPMKFHELGLITTSGRDVLGDYDILRILEQEKFKLQSDLLFIISLVSTLVYH